MAIRRIQEADLLGAQKIVNHAADTLEPETLTQRQAFKVLMPQIRILRERSVSFAQIAALLEECGIHLQMNTIRSYYSADICAMAKGDK